MASSVDGTKWRLLEEDLLKFFGKRKIGEKVLADQARGGLQNSRSTVVEAEERAIDKGGMDWQGRVGMMSLERVSVGFCVNLCYFVISFVERQRGGGRRGDG